MIAASLYPAFSRNFDDEQEYADAANCANSASFIDSDSQSPPTLRWQRKIKDSLAAQQLPFTVKTLVVGFQGGGASFAHRCFALSDCDKTEWVGTLVLPGVRETSPAAAYLSGGDSLQVADPADPACNIFRKRGEGDGRDVAVALCGYRVPSRVAHAWARALLDSIAAEVVVVLASVAIEPGRIAGWEGVRLLATSGAEEREDCLEMSRGFQPLRTPAMVTGPAAALVSYCQRHGRAAMCFTTAEWPGGKREVSGRAFRCTVQALRVMAGDAVMMESAENAGVDADDDFVDRTGNLYV